MYSRLGCSLDVLDPRPYFPHPVFGYNVYATLDICHMLKLARNSPPDLGVFCDGNRNKICWSFISGLFDLQKNWRKQKMKVKLAAQTFSRSVSDALHSSVTPI